MRTPTSLIYLSTLLWTPVLLHKIHTKVPSVFPRNYPFFDEPVKPKQLHKHFNFGYLDVNQPISSLDDLHAIKSEEIGTPRYKNQPQQASNLWKIDDVKTLAAPEVLPDIVLHPENSHRQVNVVQPKHRDGVLDESEKKLGRFVVEDTPPVRHSRPIQQNNRRPPSTFSASSFFVNNVITTTEKPHDFMEELHRMKMTQAQQQFTPDVEDSAYGDYKVNEDEIPASHEEINHHLPVAMNPQFSNNPGQDSTPIVHESPERIDEIQHHTTTPHTPFNVDQLEEILIRYLESHPQFLEQYMKRQADLESKIKSEKPSRSVQSLAYPIDFSTPASKTTENIVKPTETEKDSGNSEETFVTTTLESGIIVSDISDKEFHESITPESVTVSEMIEGPLLNVPNGNGTLVKTIKKKTKRRKKKITSTAQPNDQ